MTSKKKNLWVRPCSHYAKFCLVCKKICQRKAISSAMIFCPNKIFASATKLQRFRPLALETVKILSCEKILCSSTSIHHWVIKFCSKWITKQTWPYDFPRASVNHRMTLSIRIFLQNKISGKWCWTGADGFQNQDSARRGNIQCGWKHGDGGVFSAE